MFPKLLKEFALEAKYIKNLGVFSQKRENKDLIALLKQKTAFLPSNAAIKHRLWFVINNTNEIPLCITCNKNQVKWSTSIGTYRTYCCNTCMTHSAKTKEKRKNTIFSSYGVENVSQASIVKDKKKQTNLKKRGVENPQQDPTIKSITKQTNMTRYGVENVSQLHLSKETIQLLNNKEWLIEQNHHKQKSLTEISYFLNISPSSLGKRFKKHNIEIKKYNSSFGQKQVFDFIVTYTSVIENTNEILQSQEIDIFLPEYNLAIEYNGIYWHSEQNKPNGKGRSKNYHLNKTQECNKKDIHLIHIWETEWLLQQEIVKSRILNLIGQSNKIYARKCQIAIIDNQAKKRFLNDNHIQGDCHSSINIGLQYNNELVALMTFGKSRFNKNYEYELLRYCNKLNTSVTGGASRLFKYFKNHYNPKTIISYSDKRWNTGKLYEKLGFTYSHSSEPNFFHFHSSNTLKLYSRHQFQKHKLKNKLEKFDESLSAIKNMQNNGYDRIWDCGNAVYIWT